MRTTGRARRGTRATTACRWRRRVVPRDAGHRGQRVLSRLSGRERGTFASRLVQFAITRVAVPRRANGPDPEPPLGVHEHESSGDRREHPLMPPGVLPLSSLAAAVAVAAPGHAPCGLILRGPLAWPVRMRWWPLCQPCRRPRPAGFDVPDGAVSWRWPNQVTCLGMYLVRP